MTPDEATDFKLWQIEFELDDIHAELQELEYDRQEGVSEPAPVPWWKATLLTFLAWSGLVLVLVVPWAVIGVVVWLIYRALG